MSAKTDLPPRETTGSAVGPEWNPSRRQLAIMAILSTLSLMVALDACVIVTSLSVGFHESPKRCHSYSC
jgi:hypothetical protein